MAVSKTRRVSTASAPNGHDDLARADGEGGDRRSLQDGERVVLEQDAVRENGRIGLVGVDHDVVLVGGCARADAPFLPNAGAASGAGAAAAEHSRLGDGLDHILGRELLYGRAQAGEGPGPVSYTHLRAHETRHDLVCRLLL